MNNLLSNLKDFNGEVRGEKNPVLFNWNNSLNILYSRETNQAAWIELMVEWWLIPLRGPALERILSPIILATFLSLP